MCIIRSVPHLHEILHIYVRTYVHTRSLVLDLQQFTVLHTLLCKCHSVKPWQHMSTDWFGALQLHLAHIGLFTATATGYLCTYIRTYMSNSCFCLSNNESPEHTQITQLQVLFTVHTTHSIHTHTHTYIRTYTQTYSTFVCIHKAQESANDRPRQSGLCKS